GQSSDCATTFFRRRTARNGCASCPRKPAGTPPPFTPNAAARRFRGMYIVPNSQSQQTSTPAKFLSSATSSLLWGQWWYTGLANTYRSGPHVHPTLAWLTMTNSTAIGTAPTTAAGENPSRVNGTT